MVANRLQKAIPTHLWQGKKINPLSKPLCSPHFDRCPKRMWRRATNRPNRHKNQICPGIGWWFPFPRSCCRCLILTKIKLNKIQPHNTKRVNEVGRGRGSSEWFSVTSRSPPYSGEEVRGGFENSWTDCAREWFCSFYYFSIKSWVEETNCTTTFVSSTLRPNQLRRSIDIDVRFEFVSPSPSRSNVLSKNTFCYRVMDSVWTFGSNFLPLPATPFYHQYNHHRCLVRRVSVVSKKAKNWTVTHGEMREREREKDTRIESILWHTIKLFAVVTFFGDSSSVSFPFHIYRTASSRYKVRMF